MQKSGCCLGHISQTSIKGSTREKRGKGISKKVTGQSKVPGNWKHFLCDQDNKQELFVFLADKIAASDFPAEKQVVVTSGQRVVTRETNYSMPDSEHVGGSRQKNGASLT